MKIKKGILLGLAAAVAAGVLAGCAESESPSSGVGGASSLGGVSSLSSELESSMVSSALESSAVSSEVSSASSAASSEASSAASSRPQSSCSRSPASSRPASSSSASSASSGSVSSAVSSSPPAAASGPSVQQVRSAIAGAYGSDYLPNTQIPQEILNANFPVDASLVEEMYGETPAISVNPDMLIVIKAAPGKGAEVQQAMQKNRDMYVETAMVYPKDWAKLQASTVVRNGDYVAFLMLGAVDESMESASDEEAQAYAQEQVQKGVNAFYAATN